MCLMIRTKRVVIEFSWFYAKHVTALLPSITRVSTNPLGSLSLSTIDLLFTSSPVPLLQALIAIKNSPNPPQSFISPTHLPRHFRPTPTILTHSHFCETSLLMLRIILGTIQQDSSSHKTHRLLGIVSSREWYFHFSSLRSSFLLSLGHSKRARQVGRWIPSQFRNHLS